MKRLLILSVLATTALTAMQCCKTAPKPIDPIDLLPPATQTGENTFGCLVNGEAFVATNTNQISAVYQGGGLSISGGIVNNGNLTDIQIFTNESIQAGNTYILDNETTKKGQYYLGELDCWFSTDTIFTGKLYISLFDQQKFIVSGTFEIEAYSSDCMDTVHITNGRFDIKYIP